ncbi:Hypothetical protein D9617_13g100870 [Elsinoe fawcettii]|nr:Hypothetical protein D9617_13g100870 [Elsinoe fawcettii]
MAETNFTPTDQKILMVILANLQGDINADWAKVAEILNYKDAGIARKRWTQIRNKKILPGSAGNADNGSPVKAGKKGKGGSPGKRTSDEAEAKAEGRDAEAGGEEEEKPKKKGNGGRPAKKAKKTDVKEIIKEEVEDEDAA